MKIKIPTRPHEVYAVNSMIKYPASAIAIIVSVLSAALTFQFMTGIGQSSGLSLVFGGIGACMDMAKALLPVAVIIAHKQHKTLTALFLGLVASMLIVMSFAASVAAVESSSEQSRQQSEQYQSLTKQIELKEASLSSLPSDYITKRNQVTNDISALLAERSQLKPDSLISQYSKPIALLAAFVIELISVSMTLIVFMCSERSQNVSTEQDNGKQGGLSSPVLTVVEQPEPEQKTLVFNASVSVEEQIRDALLTRSIERPSVACVRKSFSGIASSKISEIIKDLARVGHLVPNGNRGFKYA